MDGRAVALNIIGGFAVVGMAWTATQGTLLAAIAGVAAVGLLALVVVGPVRLGFALLCLGMFLAPQNDLRPVATIVWITFSDLALALGFALLLPRLLVHRASPPVLFFFGGVSVLVLSFISSLTAASPAVSGFGAATLIASAVLLPMLFTYSGPTDRQMVALATSYVAGQLASTAAALLEGPVALGRYAGNTYHPNYFAAGGLLSIALAVYLFYEVDTRRRWVVVIAGLACAYSVSMSGSRGALLAIVVIGLAFPLIERSLVSMYLLFAGVLAAVPLLGLLVAAAPEGSAIRRILGDENVAGSDSARTEVLSEGIQRLGRSPIFGSGFEQSAIVHNIFLEVAISVGIVGLFGWLLMMAPFASSLFANTRHRHLGYVTLAYLALGMTEPILASRLAWAPMSLALIASALASADDSRATPAEDGPNKPDRPLHPEMQRSSQPPT